MSTHVRPSAQYGSPTSAAHGSPMPPRSWQVSVPVSSTHSRPGVHSSAGLAVRSQFPPAAMYGLQTLASLQYWLFGHSASLPLVHGALVAAVWRAAHTLNGPVSSSPGSLSQKVLVQLE